jgi:hypothetical protein
MSDSTYSLASSGRLVDPATFEGEIKFAAGVDWTGTLDGQPGSKRARISPMESPRLSHPERARNGSISRPVGLNNARSSPYAAAQSDRRNRWSTGSVSTPPPTTTPQLNSFSSVYGCSPLNPHNALSSVSNEHGITTFAAPGQQLSYTGNRPLSLQEAQIWGSTAWASRQHLSQFQMLAHQGTEADDADLNREPPNIYETLEGDEAPPPEDCMNPDDEDMIPRQEDPQSITDMYKPRWVRGKGHGREGWCGRCETGCWAKLKNSGFWYHRSYTHGISPNTGQPYPPPCRWRVSEGNPSRWEGLCENCGEWLKVDTTKKGHNSWFRHVVKCHPKHNKNQKRHRGAIQKRRRTLGALPHYPSPFSTDVTEERALSEDRELMEAREGMSIGEERHYAMDEGHLSHSQPHIESETVDSSSHPVIRTTSTTPPQPIEASANDEMKLSDAFHTPLNYHLLSTPMTTPQLSSTPLGDSSSTPQIETPAPTSHSLMSIHGLGVHNLMIPFGLNMGLGVVDQHGSPFGINATYDAADTFDFGHVSATTSGLDSKMIHVTSSPMDHHREQMFNPVYHTPHIIQDFSGLSVDYNGTPGLSSDAIMSVTSAPMDCKTTTGAEHDMRFGSPLDHTLF